MLCCHVMSSLPYLSQKIFAYVGVQIGQQRLCESLETTGSKQYFKQKDQPE